MTASLFVIGCGKEKEATPTPVTPAPPVASFGAPPTEEECREFGKKLEAAVAAGDVGTVRRLYRLDDLVERCFSSLNVPPVARRKFVAFFRDTGGTQLPEQLIDATTKGERFTFLRVRMVEGRPCIVMRQIHLQRGGNYHEIFLARYPDGEIAVEDYRLMTTGEKMSQTLRRFFLSVAAADGQVDLATLSPTEKAYLTHLSKLEKLILASRQGRFGDVLATYDQLPTELQKDKTFLLLALGAAQTESKEQYLRVLERFRTYHPDDPALDLHLVDYYWVKKQYKEALKYLERLNQAVGGDPNLLGMRALALVELGLYAEARVEAEKAIQQEPKLETPYWMRIAAAIKEKNYADALTWLKKVVERCEISLDEGAMRATPNFAEFAKSPQFDEFWKWYRSRGK
jgi:tetratricopeptide (TPR) repeat protein